MNYQEVVQNLTIGISGGIFSSVIVSVVFYILTEYQGEIKKANDVIFPLYYIIIVTLNKEPINFVTIKNVRKQFQEFTNNMNSYEPRQYKYEMRIAMNNISEIASNVKYIDHEGELIEDKLSDFVEDLKVQMKAIEKGIITEDQGNTIWANMLLKRRKIGASSFSEYMSAHTKK